MDSTLLSIITTTLTVLSSLARDVLAVVCHYIPAMQYLWLPLLATWGCVMTMSLFWCVERVNACRLESARVRRVYQRYGPMPSLIDDVPGDTSRHLH